jgi:DNA-directed RNA polymerase I, II, and III subunit RPABC5
MIIPIRCFTCGKTIADRYDYYMTQVAQLEQADAASADKDTKAGGAAKEKAEAEAALTKHFDPVKTGKIMDKIGLTRYCCRRHMLTTVDMMGVI